MTWADHFRTAKNQEPIAVEHCWQCESDHRASSYQKPGQRSTPIRLKSQVRGPQRLREFYPKTAKRRTATSKSKMPAAPRLTVRPLEGRKAHSRKRHGVRSPGQITFALPKWETFVNLDSYGSAKVIITSKSPNAPTYSGAIRWRFGLSAFSFVRSWRSAWRSRTRVSDG